MRGCGMASSGCACSCWHPAEPLVGAVKPADAQFEGQATAMAMATLLPFRCPCHPPGSHSLCLGCSSLNRVWFCPTSLQLFVQTLPPPRTLALFRPGQLSAFKSPLKVPFFTAPRELSRPLSSLAGAAPCVPTDPHIEPVTLLPLSMCRTP